MVYDATNVQIQVTPLTDNHAGTFILRFAQTSTHGYGQIATYERLTIVVGCQLTSLGALVAPTPAQT